MDVTQRFSSEARTAVPLTRSFPETPTGQSALVGVVRGGGWASGGLARALGAHLHDALDTSWIDRLVGLGGRGAHGVLEALDDRAAARTQRLRSIELGLIHERALLEALGEERQDLQRQVRGLEERIAERDADMHLALARGQEEAAREAILRIIPDRRRGATLRIGIERLERARQRLRAIVARREAKLRVLRAPAFVALPDEPEPQCEGLL
jgi:hypothetical protein